MYIVAICRRRRTENLYKYARRRGMISHNSGIYCGYIYHVLHDTEARYIQLYQYQNIEYKDSVYSEG